MRLHRPGKTMITVCAGVLAAGLFAASAEARQLEMKFLTVACDASCRVSLQTLSVPVGQTARQFEFTFETSWQSCRGEDRTDWFIYGLRGPMGHPVYECMEFWDKRSHRETPGPATALVLGPGTYTAYLISGPKTTVQATYFLATEAEIPAGAVGAEPVTVYRDGDCHLYPGGFRVEPGRTAVGFRFNLDSSWEACPGPDHVDHVSFVIRGPEGDDVYEYRAFYDRRTPLERPGPIAHLVLGAGNYVLLLDSGRNTKVKLSYFTSLGPALRDEPAPPPPDFEPAGLLAAIDADFNRWYVKIGGLGEDSTYRPGTPAGENRTFTWNEIAKDVLSEHVLTIPKSGRIFMDAVFRMEDRPEYGDLARDLESVGTPYLQVWRDGAWRNFPDPAVEGWSNSIGYCGIRAVQPREGFKYTGALGRPIRVLGPGLPVQAGKYRLAVLSAIAKDWTAHFPSKGRIYVYFIPDK